MGNSLAERLDEDEYFTDINYDLFSDEELDELYDFGALRSARKSRKANKQSTKNRTRRNMHRFDDEFLGVDIESDEEFDEFDDYDDYGDYDDYK